HPQYQLAKKQQLGSGAMLSFELAGTIEQVEIFLDEIALFCLAESLGGVKSLLCYPAQMTHKSTPRDVRLKAGIADSLVRLSCGIEDAEDLIKDLEEAIEAAKETRKHEIIDWR
ncbi:MAG: PLP-dependent transferase, partial [Flavobacteriales bacterium]|nr:PLP-dependent transferase [Flavobacteriales bacterium]